MAQTNDWPQNDIPPKLPVLLLKSTVLFPMQVASLQLALKPNLQVLEDYPNPDQIVGAGAFLYPDSSYSRSNLCSIAVTCKVLSRIKMAHGTTQVVLQGLRRVELLNVEAARPYFKAKVREVSEPRRDSAGTRDLIAEVIRLVKELVATDDRYNEELVKVVQLNVENGSRCADLVADMIQFGYVDKRKVLETVDVPERLELVTGLLKREIAKARAAKELQVKTELSLDRSQREAFLREQLEIIRDELNEIDPADAEIAELAAKVMATDLPPRVAEEAHRQVLRLHDAETRAFEGFSIRGYIDWLLSMPWHKSKEDRHDLRRAHRILENRYFGLGNATDRLLEFLAVRKLGGTSMKPLLGIMGPPGTGRTSLAETVARILDRPFMRINVHGIHDESEIRGESRASAAARPGRILNAIQKAGVNNPVILFDEIDWLEAGVGDPMLAIIEALDPTRNCHFYDQYLGVPFDLSKVLFIVTANLEAEIPQALFDLMYPITLAGYTEGVKMAIARERIWPHVLEEHGLPPRAVRITNAALRRIIREYTMEAGVHSLQLQLETICRRVAVKMANAKPHHVTVNTKNLEKYVGAPVYTESPVERDPQVGAAVGLAWTETGGNLLPVEALLMPGDGKTLLTGMLGEVMQESVTAAFSYVRSRADELGIPAEALVKKDLHIHFPEGAIPKDGPSAGVVVATAIASLLSGRPVRQDVAMTGEISLRGWIYPIGGLREKVLAAYRAGITHVVLPKGNESDLSEVPPDVLSKMHVHLVAQVSEVFGIALEKKPKKNRHKS